MRRLAAALLALGLLLGAPASALSQGPKASLPDIEDEVMCVVCGTLLELSGSPSAQRQKVFIREQIALGRDKEEIKDALVAEYGEEVLALPDNSGFDLTAYAVPAVGVALGAGGIAFGVLGWRRRREEEAASETATRAPEGAAAERLDADIARYDL